MTLKEEYRKYHETGKCRCTLREKLVGSGCAICSPDYAKELVDDHIAELEAERDRYREALESLNIKHSTSEVYSYSCPMAKDENGEYSNWRYDDCPQNRECDCGAEANLKIISKALNHKEKTDEN